MQTEAFTLAPAVPPSNGLLPRAPGPRHALILQPHEHAHLASFLEDYLQTHGCGAHALAQHLTISTNYLNAMKGARNLRLGKAPTYRIVRLMAARLDLPLEALLGPPLPPPEPERIPITQEPAMVTAPVSEHWEILMGALLYEARMLRELLERHLRGETDSDMAPLDYLHRYWRLVSGGERLRFLTEMLTPNERRALQFGGEEDA